MNIIEKEKARQEDHFRLLEHFKKAPNNMNIIEIRIIEHKQSLINLKEYMEEVFEDITEVSDVTMSEEDINIGVSTWQIMLKQDIKELTKLIEAYE